MEFFINEMKTIINHLKDYKKRLHTKYNKSYKGIEFKELSYPIYFKERPDLQKKK